MLPISKIPVATCLFFIALLSPVSIMAADAPAARPLGIISDIDDTIRYAHIGSAELVPLALVRNLAFPGMNVLLSSLSGNGPMVFASGSPDNLVDRVNFFLTNNAFPSGKLLMRSSLFDEIYTFKTNAIGEVLKMDAAPVYVALGDDTEKDPLVYRDLSQQFPGRIIATYIHAINGFEERDGQLPFYTALDVALHEYAAGRLRDFQVSAVARELLRHRNRLALIIPPFGRCPQQNWLSKIKDRHQLDAKLSPETNAQIAEVQQLLAAHCDTRAAGAKQPPLEEIQTTPEKANSAQ